MSNEQVPDTGPEKPRAGARIAVLCPCGPHRNHGRGDPPLAPAGARRSGHRLNSREAGTAASICDLCIAGRPPISVSATSEHASRDHCTTCWRVQSALSSWCDAASGSGCSPTRLIPTADQAGELAHGRALVNVRRADEKIQDRRKRTGRPRRRCLCVDPGVCDPGRGSGDADVPAC